MGAEAEGCPPRRRKEAGLDATPTRPRGSSTVAFSVAECLKNQAAGTRREGPSMRKVTQRWRRRSSSAATMAFCPKKLYHSS